MSGHSGSLRFVAQTALCPYPRTCTGFHLQEIGTHRPRWNELHSGQIWPPICTCIPQALNGVHPLLPLGVFFFYNNKALLAFVVIKDNTETNSADLILKRGVCSMS